MNVQLIPAGKAEIPEIAALADKIWNEHYPNIIGQVQVDYMLEKIYNASSLAAQMDEGQQFFFIEYMGRRCGFLSVSQKNSGCFIHKFYVDVSEHGKGLGTAAFEALMEHFPHISEYRLQVNRQNHKAINFYFKLGFVIEKVADFDIGDGYFMNDFVMVKKG